MYSFEQKAEKLKRSYTECYNVLQRKLMVKNLVTQEEMNTLNLRQLISRIPSRITVNNDITIRNISVSSGNTELVVRWTEPTDSDGFTWQNTKVVYKEGSYPTSVSDGTLAVENTTRDNYSTNGFRITNLTNDTEYFISFFVFNTNGEGFKNENNRAKGTPREYDIMTVVIDINNEDPEARCTYANKATTMTPKSEEWDTWFDFFPCVLNQGQVFKRLKRNNRREYEDGSSAEVFQGREGDSMMCYSLKGVKLEKVGDTLEVSMTNGRDVAGFQYFAHSRGDVVKDNLYLGAYLACEVDGRLRSLSNKQPLTRLTLSQGRQKAQANGAGYDQWGFYQILFIETMYLLKYKNTNSQEALGKGFTAGEGIYKLTGQNDLLPLDYAEDSEYTPMTLFGIENFWGNVWQWVEGFRTDDERNILTATENFNDTGDGYTNHGQLAGTENINGYTKTVIGTNEGGFITTNSDASNTTYYCDFGYLGNNSVPNFGGMWPRGSGAFCFDAFVSPTASDPTIGTRLMYL